MDRHEMLLMVCGTAALAWHPLGAVVLPTGVVEGVRNECSRTCPARVVSVAEVAVRPQVDGEILEVGFANGQDVTKGDVLYRIDAVKYVAAEKNAEAKVSQIRANLEYAETQATRYGELVKTRAVPQDDFDRVRSQRDAMRAALAAAEADLVSARDDVRHCTITAPISGRVGSTSFTEGNFVKRGGDVLVRLVQTSPVRVAFEVSSVDYAADFGSDAKCLVEEGRVALRRMSVGELVATGRVEYVENVANAATDSVRVFALVDNGGGKLLAGQTVVATLANACGATVPAVPPNAVALDARGAYVWVVGADGVVRRRTVVRGRMQGRMQMVKSGLSVGERIVVDGVHRAKEGDVVEGK